MLVRNNWWIRQLLEHMQEAFRLFKGFKYAKEPNIDDLDKALATHQECCQAYQEIKNLDFEDFIELGECLCARQASLQKSNKL